MKLCTFGRKFYEDYEFPVSTTEDTGSLKSEDAKNYYKIIYLNRDSTQLFFNGNRLMLMGQYLICMNEKDEIDFIDMLKAGEIQIMFIKPEVFNEKLSFDACNHAETLPIIDMQDAFYFNRFKWDAKLGQKVLSLDEHSGRMVRRKLTKAKEILSNQDSIFWPCMCRTNAMEILFYLSELEEEEKDIDCEVEGYSKLVLDVISYIQIYYGEKLTLEDMAARFGTNRTTLLNEFKQNTGKSLNQYVKHTRLKIATTLLKDTMIPIAEICDRTGFYDMSYFSKVFKQEIHYTPGEYRKIYNKLD